MFLIIFYFYWWEILLWICIPSPYSLSYIWVVLKLLKHQLMFFKSMIIQPVNYHPILNFCCLQIQIRLWFFMQIVKIIEIKLKASLTLMEQRPVLLKIKSIMILWVGHYKLTEFSHQIIIKFLSRKIFVAFLLLSLIFNKIISIMNSEIQVNFHTLHF